MHNLQAIPDSNFVHRAHNMGGNMTAGNTQVFANEAALDTAANTLVPAKDRPHLTMNDKVFAARIATFSGTAIPFESDEEPEPVVDEEPEPVVEEEPVVEAPVKATTTK
jgi:hypothetical protein